MDQRYSPVLSMSLAMGPTMPMLSEGPFRRMRLTSWPGVVTFHYYLAR